MTSSAIGATTIKTAARRIPTADLDISISVGQDYTDYF
jgi:hypothetical protein